MSFTSFYNRVVICYCQFFNILNLFLANFYRDECIWCILTGGVFAKAFDPIKSDVSIICIKPVGNYTNLHLGNFSITRLDNCTDDEILMTQPLIYNQILCDPTLSKLIQAVNQTLTQDKLGYSRDFIGKAFFI